MKLKIKKVTDKEDLIAAGFWESVYRFRIIEPNTNIKEIAKWMSFNFAEGFVLISVNSQRIAGGYVDNKEGWKSQENAPEDESYNIYYELRCSESDGTLFLLKYQ